MPIAGNDRDGIIRCLPDVVAGKSCLFDLF